MSSPPWIDWRQLLDQRRDKKWDNFSWLTLRALLSSANDVIAKGAPRLVRDLRGRWMSLLAASENVWSEELIVDMTDAHSFLVLGDPGEQDASQYAVVPALCTEADADFLVICSDVIYPAGDVNDYVDGYYLPYQQLGEMPIFAIPGNHDWYDGLNGFMWHFCGLDALPPTDYLRTSYGIRERVAGRLWRRASRPQRDLLVEWRRQRAPSGQAWHPQQPGPYWAVETADLLIVGIDTGITGELDREQGDWLLRVSAKRKPKVLLTGKPLLVDYMHRPYEIVDEPGGPTTDYPTIDEVVRDPRFHYVAAIGGDIHNYQHDRVTLPERPGETFDYVVAGGGGAFMSATHPIPVAEGLKPDNEDRADLLDGVNVEHFDCYPTRVDSLRFYSRRFVPRLRRLVLRIVLALLGIALAAGLVLVFDLDENLLHGLLIGSSAVTVGWIASIGMGLGRGTRARLPLWRQRISTLISGVAGFCLGLAGWWLAPDQFGENLLAAGGLILGGALIARFLRAAGHRAWKPWWAQVIVYGVQLAGVIAVAVVVAPSGTARDVVVAVVVTLAALALIPAINLGLVGLWPKLRQAVDKRRGRQAPRRIRPRGPISIVLATALTAIAIAVVLLVVDGGDETRAVLTAVGALIVLAVTPLLIDYVRRIAPNSYKVLIGIVLVGIAGLIGALGIHETWVAQAAVAAVTLLAIALLGIAIAHLVFLGAFGLLLPFFGAGDGNLSDDEAERGLAWRDGRGPRPQERRLRQILNLVHPGPHNPNGPLHQKISEIFDSDDAPFYKSFLRLDARDGVLTIRCFGVTGEEKSDEDVTVVDTIEIPLPSVSAGAPSATAS